MQRITPLDVPSLKITVTSTATALYTLMDTAGSLKAGSNYQYYHEEDANGILITPEDGNVRMLSGANPTATVGTLLTNGVSYFIPNTDISTIRLIRTVGDVLTSVEPCRTVPGEAFNGTGATGTGTSTVTNNITNNTTATGAIAGNLNWSNVYGDFTATANAATKTVTLSAFASTLASAALVTENFANAFIRRVSSAGVVDTLPMTTVAYVNATGVLTIDSMVAVFDAGDTVAVFIPCNDKGYEEANDLLMTHVKPIATNLFAYSIDQSAALEASTVTKASSGNAFLFSGRIDKTAPSGTYYVQALNHASVPADGAVTMLHAPASYVHVTGEHTSVEFRYPECGIYANTGIVYCLSSTDFTKTLSGAYLSSTVFYK